MAELGFFCFNYLPGGVATCSEGFVISFLKVPLLAWATWQLKCSPTACGTLRKQFTKPSEQVTAPPSSNRGHLDGQTIMKF